MAPTLSRVNSHAFVFKALLHCATPVKSSKYERVDGNSKGLLRDKTWCQAHRAPDPVADANMYFRWPKQVRPLNGGRHGLLCRGQEQSLLNVGGRYNAILFKLSRQKGREFTQIVHCSSSHVRKPTFCQCCSGTWFAATASTFVERTIGN